MKQQNKRFRNQIINLKEMNKSLKERNLVDNSQYAILQSFEDDESILCFLTRFAKKVNNPHFKTTYPLPLRTFAVTLHYLSPRAYRYLRSKFGNCLPSSSTLKNWYKSIDGSPGFSMQALGALTELCKDQIVILAILKDEMHLRENYCNGKGRVQFGHSGETLNDCNLLEELANQALVFMAVGVKPKFKILLGYFLIRSLTAEQSASLTRLCCQNVFQCGENIDLVSCAFNGMATNLSMCTILKANLDLNNLDPFFDIEGKKVGIVLDPPHMLKNVRNMFGTHKIFFDASDRKINFEYLELLVEVQAQIGLQLGNKVKSKHIVYKDQKMKVSLATELLSLSTANALAFLKNELKVKCFQESGPTITFIQNMNNAFDILNSRSNSQNPYKQPMTAGNISFFQDFYDSFINYIKSLKYSQKGKLKFIYTSQIKTGFIGLVISLKTCIEIGKRLILIDKKIESFSVHFIIQDHLECFLYLFSVFRSMNGYNPNPNVVQFDAAFKKILMDSLFN